MRGYRASQISKPVTSGVMPTGTKTFVRNVATCPVCCWPTCRFQPMHTLITTAKSLMPSVKRCLYSTRPCLPPVTASPYKASHPNDAAMFGLIGSRVLRNRILHVSVAGLRQWIPATTHVWVQPFATPASVCSLSHLNAACYCC